MPDLCCAVVPAVDGVVVAFRTLVAHFDVTSARLTPIVEVEPPEYGNRLNEAKCDRAGRLWIGSMRDFGEAVSGSLYVIGADRAPRPILRNICIPNSLAWSPDSTTMYFADTRTRTLMAYPFDLASGAIGAGTVLLGPDDAPGVPDGSAVDSEGFIWNARFRAGLVVRVSPQGQIVERVALPVTQPTSCAFGGIDLRTLFVTTARQRLSDNELATQPSAGHLFAVHVDTPGLPDSEFGFM